MELGTATMYATRNSLEKESARNAINKNIFLNVEIWPRVRLLYFLHGHPIILFLFSHYAAEWITLTTAKLHNTYIDLYAYIYFNSTERKTWTTQKHLGQFSKYRIYQQGQGHVQHTSHGHDEWAAKLVTVLWWRKILAPGNQLPEISNDKNKVGVGSGCLNAIR